jgi:hypothetical protein
MALKAIKSSKVAGADRVLQKFLKFLGPKGRNWLSKLAIVVAKISKIQNYGDPSKL